MKKRKFGHNAQVIVAPGHKYRITDPSYRAGRLLRYYSPTPGCITGCHGDNLSVSWIYAVQTANPDGKEYDSLTVDVPEPFLQPAPPAQIQVEPASLPYKNQTHRSLTSSPCPRCQARLPHDQRDCPDCGWPGMRAIPGSCRHPELRRIQFGGDAGKFSCRSPGCQARFRLYEGLTRAGKLDQISRDLRADPPETITRGPDDIEVGGEDYFAVVLLYKEWGRASKALVLKADNEQAKPPDGGYGWKV